MLHVYFCQIRLVCLLEKDVFLQNHFVKGMSYLNCYLCCGANILPCRTLFFPLCVIHLMYVHHILSVSSLFECNTSLSVKLHRPFYYRMTSDYVNHQNESIWEQITKGTLILSSKFLAHLSRGLMSFSDRPSSVYPSVRPSINFSHFNLLLQNHWAKFNLT